ncbi:Protein ILITYHIA, partial [Bienertia sinuspersici]
MADSIERLCSLGESVTTPSTKLRIRIFRHDIPDLLDNTDMSSEVAAVLVDIIFKTLCIYEDLRSRKAVDDIVLKALNEATFMKTFAACLVQFMERLQKCHSYVGSYKLLRWSCFLHQISTKTYIEELKGARIPEKECPDIIWLLIEYSRKDPCFEQYKPIFIDLYVKTVLSAREKPAKGLSEAFCPLFLCLTHEEFGNIIVPSSVKMLKRNPEIALEAVEILLKSVSIDLSKYSMEFLPVVLTQARHADEGRRVGALAIIQCLSKKSSNPDVIEMLFKAVKAVIGGSEGRLQFPYQRVGMFSALRELSSAPGGKLLKDLSSTLCGFLLSCYKDEGNEEVKLAILSALACWLERGADCIQPAIISFFTSGLKEKEGLRRGHLRCLRVICNDADNTIQVSSLVGPLIQIVKTGYTKSVQRLDCIYALLLVAKISAVDMKAEEAVMKEKIWSLVAQNEPSLVPLSMVPKLSGEDGLACVDLLHVLLVDHTKRVLETFSVDTLFQLLFILLCHPSWHIRKAAYGSTKRIIEVAPQASEALLKEFAVFPFSCSRSSSFTDKRHRECSRSSCFFPSICRGNGEGLSACIVSSCCGYSRDMWSHYILLTSSSFTWHWKERWNMAEDINMLADTGIDVVSLINGRIKNICEDLLGTMGLMSAKCLEQEGAAHALCTLMTLAPNDTYLEFEKHFSNLPDRFAHNTLSPNDIQVKFDFTH